MDPVESVSLDMDVVMGEDDCAPLNSVSSSKIEKVLSKLLELEQASCEGSGRDPIKR